MSLILGSMGETYGRLPSELAGMPQNSGSLLFDMRATTYLSQDREEKMDKAQSGKSSASTEYKSRAEKAVARTNAAQTKHREILCKRS